MSGPTASQSALVRALKAGHQSVHIPVFAGDGTTIGRVEPITYADAGRRDLHDALSRWRRNSATAFLTVFESTPERTEAFLSHVSLPSPSRLLCLVRDATGKPVGNIGLCHIEPASAEFDNFLRGEPAPRGFMGAAARAFLAWAFAALAVDDIYLHVLEDNVRAIAVYDRLGFVPAARRRLWRKATADGYQLLQEQVEGAVPSPVGLLRMTLSSTGRTGDGR